MKIKRMFMVLVVFLALTGLILPSTAWSKARPKPHAGHKSHIKSDKKHKKIKKHKKKKKHAKAREVGEKKAASKD